MRISLSALVCVAILSSDGWSQVHSAVDVSVGAAYTYRYLGGSFTSGIYADETGRPGVTAGVQYNRRINDKFCLRTGLEYATFGYKSAAFAGFRWGDQVGPDFVFDPTIPTQEPLTDLRYKYRHVFIGIPVLFRHQFAAKKWIPYVEAGIVPSLLLVSRTKQVTNVETKVFSSKDDTYPDLNTFRLVAQVSFGAQYDVGPGLALFGQPVVRYHTTPSSKGSKEHLYGIGLDVGIRKELK